MPHNRALRGVTEPVCSAAFEPSHGSSGGNSAALRETKSRDEARSVPADATEDTALSAGLATGPAAWQAPRWSGRLIREPWFPAPREHRGPAHPQWLRTPLRPQKHNQM